MTDCLICEYFEGGGIGGLASYGGAGGKFSCISHE
jgi:hypothetical protein